MAITLTINGRERVLNAPANATLLETLREHGYFEVKSGCEKGDCGACAILVDGVALDSCLTLTWTVADCAITTVAGLSEAGTKHPLIESFETTGAVQCGYCTPGLILAAQSMLATNPDPSDDEIREGLSGNLCRCTGYTKVFDAVREAAKTLREKGSAA